MLQLFDLIARRRRRSWIAWLLPLALVTGCSDASRDRAPASDSLRFVDDLDREVELGAPAERIVALAPNLTEIAFAAGAGAQVVGAGVPDDYPAAVDTLPRFSILPLDFEALAALEPQLALATDQVNNPRDAAILETLGIHTAFFTFDQVGDIFRAIEEVGRLAATSPSADRAADSLREAFADVRRRTAGLTSRPRVLFLIGDETLYAFGRHSYVQDLVEAAGGESLTADLDRRAPVLTEEFVVEQRPDVIVGAWGRGYDVARLGQLHPAWHDVPAIRDGRVFTVDADLFLRPGPRVVSGTRHLAALLHPSTFAPSDTATVAAR